MIYTVTLNPAIDKTIQLNGLKPGALNIVEKSLTNIGGKGINVSLVLKALGTKSMALGMAGGRNGRYIADGLTQSGIEHFFLNTGKDIRTNIKIMERDGTLTELNEKGASVEPVLVDEFVKEVKARIAEKDILVLSGSVPAGVPATIYADLIKIAHCKGAIAILDADGELFAYGVEAGPDVVKPNISEFTRYMKKEDTILSEEDIIIEAKKFFDKGIPQVILSMGDRGAYFFNAKGSHNYYCKALPVSVQSTVGAGDSMTAAWAHSMDKGYSFEESVKLAMAASAAAVSTPGTMAPTKEQIEEIQSLVKVEVK